MKKIKQKVLVIILLILYPLLLHGKIITDIYNRKVLLPDKINKIVALGPGALRFIVYMGETRKICGIENIEFKLQKGIVRPYSFKIDKIIKKLPVIGEGGPGKMPYFEKLALVKPDIIIAVGYTVMQANLIFYKTKVPVILLSYGKLGMLGNNFFNSLKILGKILNKEKRATHLINYIKNIEKDLKERTEKVLKRKKVYIGGIAYKGLHDITSTDTEFAPLKYLKVENVAENSPLKGHVFINWENLIISQPEYIFIDRTSLPIILPNLKKMPEKYFILSAFKNKKVYTILPYNYYNTNVELSLIISYFIGKTVYPSKFKNLDFYKKANEIIQNFIGIKEHFKFSEFKMLLMNN